MIYDNFFIDKITNSIENALTGQVLKTDVLPFTSDNLKEVLKKYGWRFSWRKEFKSNDRHLYKLVIRGDTTIQGLISLQRLENYIEMYLIETAPDNYGRSKRYLGVAGNLVAFACKESFDAGFEGFVAFRAKTKLIQHYRDTLGAELLFGDRMNISGNSSKKLVN